jgi:hypothetical protein
VEASGSLRGALQGFIETHHFWAVFYIVTGEPFKQSAELTGEPIKMKG